ncbi:MAG: O-antigen ligase family protein [Thermodesulfobacteriota bacterium]
MVSYLRSILFVSLGGVLCTPLLFFSYSFAHETSIPKAISGLTLLWLILPLFVIYIYRTGRVELPLFFSFFLLFLTFFLSGFSFQALNWNVVDRVDYLVYLYLFVITYLILILVYNLRPAPNEKRAFLGIILGLSVVEAIIGLLQHKGLGEAFRFFTLGTTKVSGTIGYSNYLAFFLSLGMISALFFWLQYREWFKERMSIRGTGFLFIVGLVFAILNITGSRAGLIDTILGLTAFLFLTYRFKGREWLRQRKGWVILFFAVLLFATLITNLNIKKSVGGGGMSAVKEFSEDISAPGSINDRVVMWLSAVEMFKDHSITGVGLGNYSNHYSNYMKEALISYPSDALRGSATFHRHTHNDYLEILTETGALGLSAFFIFIFSLGRRFNRALRENKGTVPILRLRSAPSVNRDSPQKEKLTAITLVAMTIPFLFDSFVSQGLHYFPFLVLLAIILAQIIPENGERSLTLNKRYLKISFVVVVFLSIINIRTMIDIGRADIELEKGFVTRDISYFLRAMKNPVARQDALPYYSQLLFEGGMARDDRKLMDEGLKVMEEYYRFQPSSDMAHRMGLYYIAFGDKEEAFRWWKEGLSFQPTYQPILDSMEDISSPEDRKTGKDDGR